MKTADSLALILITIIVTLFSKLIFDIAGAILFTIYKLLDSFSETLANYLIGNRNLN